MADGWTSQGFDTWNGPDEPCDFSKVHWGPGPGWTAEEIAEFRRAWKALAADNPDDRLLKPMSKTAKKPAAVLTPTTWHCPCGKTVLYTIKYCPNCGSPGIFGA